MRITITNPTGETYTETIAPIDIEKTSAQEDFATTYHNEIAKTQSSLPKDASFVSSSGSAELDGYFQEAADTYGVDRNLLIAMAKQESNFHADATSSSGAMGIMQLMPYTAESLGVDDPYDARSNIMGGAHYISNLLFRYQGDVSLALAAYNAGSGNVARYGGIPPFEQTKNYVEKVMDYYKNGVNPTVVNNSKADSDSVNAYRQLLGNINRMLLDRISDMT